ncbi:MAG: hypothetical protein PHN69_03460 [Candidatus Pacebacteria bacterium]|nr:hypothetical protein [Candidatus Paceibacterota bacterium]
MFETTSTYIIDSGKYLLILLPITMPFILVYFFWTIRFNWLTMKFVEKQKNCLLQIKLPKEILKSPAAMEIFFAQLTPGGAGTYYEAFIDGKTRPWFSCELVSIEGEVRFYIWCSQSKFRNIIEAQLYAQYPNIEIYEVEDYTKDIPFDLDNYSYYTIQYKLGKPDPLPIKTYIDYGLDKDQKDEYKIDPITSMLEFLGTLKKGENIWFQFLLQKYEESDIKLGTFKKNKSLKEKTKEEIEKIRKEAIPPGGDKDTFKFPNPTKGQNEAIAAIERSTSKASFECMIRGIYVAEKDAFNPINITSVRQGFKQYDSSILNSIKPGEASDVSDARKDWALFIPFMKQINNSDIYYTKKDMFHAYKLRSYFQPPYKYMASDPFVLTSEELATIFHFPSGMVSQTPTLKRVNSKKSEAPSNLPI